ncbi:hypothetical protein [Synechocystis sp. CS-94]|uniref:hypothetical protein n=1 Tax=Synechocystis sp. CS-94 TaxID=2847986 RepID=UPI0011875542|nr:hypothetical protein [Synechocystis sp. CS-94]MCT0253498.1 hypothetical protein [Synechocystis sp. CS-94]
MGHPIEPPEYGINTSKIAPKATFIPKNLSYLAKPIAQKSNKIKTKDRLYLHPQVLKNYSDTLSVAQQ